MRFAHDLGDGASLVLRTLDTVDEAYELTLANLGRLRRWEEWAQAEQTRESVASWTRRQLTEFARGAALPALLSRHGVIVGSVGATVDPAGGRASLGYWVDAAAEGQGLVGRACRALVRSLAADGITRIEVRTVTGNERSRRVALRLGLSESHVLPGARRIGGVVHDEVVYTLSP
ncbi:GNAT family N-acetyltransferase [Microbacterium marinilacus]|uniref:GNAT family protein n=1 Tax=Microbacterium marinilacus TaxID=415209 RepID=A0ABP7B3K8_9MICO|nr:GNAT family protein [Microbacterium marinilacus]MBY0688553.1 GNAT family N-acetyltransferase [Microbacterium marinilacus]